MFFPSFLEDPKMRKMREKRQKEYYEETLVPLAEEWDEDKTKFKDPLVLKASSWNPKKLFRTKNVPVSKIRDPKAHKKSPSGKYLYGNQVFPRGNSLDLFQSTRRGSVYFDDDVVIPTLLSSKSDCDSKLPVLMSYTPAEILSQRQAIRLATGKVLIGGLGLGYLLRKVAEKRSVKEIVLVEISKEILEWYGADMCHKVCANTGTPIHVIRGDAMEEVGQHGEDTRHLLDIWMSFNRWPNQKEQVVAKSVRHFWAWGWAPRSEW